MLSTEFLPALEERHLLYSCHFQQDGAPAHTATATREFLNAKFSDRWVGKYGPISWPARSPDLSSCNNALWGMLKPNVMSAKFRTKEELKDIITQEINHIDTSTLQAIHDRTFRRMQLCNDHNGPVSYTHLTLPTIYYV